MSTVLLLLLVQLASVIILICNATKIERFITGGYDYYDSKWYPFLNHPRMILIKIFWFVLPLYSVGGVFLIAALYQKGVIS